MSEPVFQQFKRTKPVLFSCLVAAIALLAMVIGGMIAGAVGVFIGNQYYPLMLLQEVFAAAVALGLAWLCGHCYTLTRRGAGLLHAMQVGAYPLALIILVAMSMGMMGAQSGRPLQPATQIVAYFLCMLSVGFVEELVFRGIIAETLIAHYGTSVGGVWKAAAISGVIFGVAHVSNLFGAAPLGVLVQVVVAAVLGMLFAAIYYRTGNLWICIFLHAGINAGSMLDQGLYGSGTLADFVSELSIANLTPCLTYGIPVLFLLRRRKNAEIQFWFGKKEDVELTEF